MSIFLIITRFMPLLITLIQLLSSMFPAAKIGPFKFAVATKVLVALKPYLSAGTVPIDELLTTVVPGLITEIVAAMNGTPETWTAPIATEPK